MIHVQGIAARRHWARAGHLARRDVAVTLTAHRRDRHLVCTAGVLAALAFSVAGCTSGGTSGAARAPAPSRAADPRTRQALIAIAVTFNDDYAANKDGLVYDRWDVASRAVISRASYVRRHLECDTAPGPAIVESASPASGGYWRVDYAISGIQLVDYWRYTKGRWLFDLARSNPAAVKLYRLPFATYAKKVGCSPSG